MNDQRWLDLYDTFALDIDDDILDECDSLYDPRYDRYYIRAAQLFASRHPEVQHVS